MNVTGIGWTNFTWNFLRGCTRVSEGCRFCYAEVQARRHCGPGRPYEGLVKLGPKGPRWTGVVREIEAKLVEPLRLRQPSMIFVNSMSDVFHESVRFELLAAAFGVMAATPEHTYQLLTKRLHQAQRFFAWLDGVVAKGEAVAVERAREGGYGALSASASPPSHVGVLIDYARRYVRHPRLEAAAETAGRAEILRPAPLWPLPNVQLVASVEDPSTAQTRIDELLRLPAWTRGVSYEPALAAVDFAPFLPPAIIAPSAAPDAPDATLAAVARMRRARRATGHLEAKLDWVIVGGESGGGHARPFDVEWARAVIAHGRASAVPVFMKQFGCWPYEGREWSEGPDALRNLRFRLSLPGRPKGRPWIDLGGGARDKGDDPEKWPAEFRVQQHPARIGKGEARELQRVVVQERRVA